MIELVGRLRFEPGQKRQNFFQLIQPLPFGRFMSSYLIRAPLIRICGIKTNGTMLAAVLASETSDETRRPSARVPTAVMNINARCTQNMPRTLRTSLPIKTNSTHWISAKTDNEDIFAKM